MGKAELVDFNEFENLGLLFWDFPAKTVPVEVAFRILDTRLAKYLDKDDLLPDENQLVARLADEFGGGICDGWNG